MRGSRSRPASGSARRCAGSSRRSSSAPASSWCFCANTINVGADLGAVAAGGSTAHRQSRATRLVGLVPVALLIGFMQLRLSYSIIFRCFKYLTLALFAYVITVVIVHPALLATVEATFIPHFEFNKEFVGIVVAILGTTISPYLFFWQASSEVDEMKAAGATTEQERRGHEPEGVACRADRRVGRHAVLPAGDVLHHPRVRDGAAHARAYRHRERAAGCARRSSHLRGRSHSCSSRSA